MKRFTLLLSMFTLLGVLSSCSFLSQNKGPICGTQSVLCDAASELWVIHGDTSSAAYRTLQDLCEGASYLCSVIPSGTQREVLIARARYAGSRMRFEELTTSRDVATAAGARAVHNYYEARDAFEREVKSKAGQ